MELELVDSMSDRLAIGAALGDRALAATTADTHTIDAVACSTKIMEFSIKK